MRFSSVSLMTSWILLDFWLPHFATKKTHTHKHLGVCFRTKRKRVHGTHAANGVYTEANYWPYRCRNDVLLSRHVCTLMRMNAASIFPIRIATTGALTPISSHAVSERRSHLSSPGRTNRTNLYPRSCAVLTFRPVIKASFQIVLYSEDLAFLAFSFFFSLYDSIIGRINELRRKVESLNSLCAMIPPDYVCAKERYEKNEVLVPSEPCVKRIGDNGGTADLSH